MECFINCLSILPLFLFLIFWKLLVWWLHNILKSIGKFGGSFCVICCHLLTEVHVLLSFSRVVAHFLQIFPTLWLLFWHWPCSTNVKIVSFESKFLKLTTCLTKAIIFSFLYLSLSISLLLLSYSTSFLLSRSSSFLFIQFNSLFFLLLHLLLLLLLLISLPLLCSLLSLFPFPLLFHSLYSPCLYISPIVVGIIVLRVLMFLSLSSPWIPNRFMKNQTYPLIRLTEKVEL